MPDHRYVARFGWSRRDLILLPGSILAIFLGVLLFADEPLLGAVFGVVGAGYIVLSILFLVSRRVALAVTAEGITLGLVPPWPASRSSFVPWSDIEAVVLWQQKAIRGATLQYIGVARRPGAPPLPGSARSSTLRSLNMTVVPGHLSEDLVADSRPVSFWRLDKTRLTTAVRHFRPDVPIVDQS